jgi:hypothetical protein
VGAKKNYGKVRQFIPGGRKIIVGSKISYIYSSRKSVVNFDNKINYNFFPLQECWTYEQSVGVSACINNEVSVRLYSNFHLATVTVLKWS